MRNWLFKSYVKIVNAINPAGFVFENVKGITNLDGGKFFSMISNELEQCVEKIKVNKVNSAEFAIPQRRERVIIIGGKEEFIDEFELAPLTGAYKDGQIGILPQVIGVKEAIGDLPPLNPAEDGSQYEYCSPPQNLYQRFNIGRASCRERV